MKPGFLSESVLEELTTSQILASGDSTYYGIGWGSRHENGEHVISHNGGSVGGITVFRIYKSSGLIIVLLSNSSDTQYGNVTNRIVELFLDARRGF
jgi:CubicO group peptidase (beta-lactamase class C family)